MFYSNFLSEGTIPLNNPIMETAELYFTDEDNDSVLSLEECTIILTLITHLKKQDKKPWLPREQEKHWPLCEWNTKCVHRVKDEKESVEW